MIRRAHLTENRALRALAQGITSPAPPSFRRIRSIHSSRIPARLAGPRRARAEGRYRRLWWLLEKLEPGPRRRSDGPQHYHLVSFIESLYFQSQMTVGLLSNISGFLPVFVSGPEPKNVNDARNIEVLTPDQGAGVRDFVNQLSRGPQRLYSSRHPLSGHGEPVRDRASDPPQQAGLVEGLLRLPVRQAAHGSRPAPR